MNEQTTTHDRLAKEIDALLAPYPDPMSRNDFRQACHIGTRTSLYLLQNGLVPCIHTGKRTRCYKIAKADVAAYSGQTPVGCTAGKSWTPVHHKARRSLPDGLGIH